MNGYYRDFFLNTARYMTRPLLPVLLAIGLLAGSGVAAADDEQPPLFVTTSGTDAGNCQDTASPCRTIEYALKRVGKNGQIRVASGSYTLAAVEDVVYMLSSAIDVRGGFSEADRLSEMTGAETTLIGAPFEFADDLARRGFRVIADSKSVGKDHAPKTKALVSAQMSLKSNAAATPCIGGSAGAFPCSNVDLLAHIADRTTTANGADIWGFMDLNTNREYAIVGYTTGTAVYDVTDPENPREVGFVDGQTTTWRDIKVYQFWNSADSRWNAYAYITADNASDGLFIIDLSELPHTIARIDYPSDFAQAHNIYLTNTEFSTGISLNGNIPTLILAGSNSSDGRFRSYALTDPAAPGFIATPATPGTQPGNDRLYMHDAASMNVTDARKDSQCVNASSAAYCDVLFDFNEATVDIWDVTDPSDPARLSSTPYDNADYVHSGWWSEDQQYLFVQDETDERDRGLLTTLRVFLIADLTAPTLAGTWTGPTSAIDHNGFVRGNRYYMSNYARGLTILDITNPASPTSVGRFDTYPSSDTVGFPGAWGTYPFLPSGNVVISDIDSGLYVVADKTLDVAEGTLAFGARSFAAEEMQSGGIVVQRNGGSQGAVAVNWEVIAATASNDDVSVTSGTLNWGAGDSTSRIINVTASNDAATEGLERLIIKLTSPSGGATLSSPSIASLYISDPGSASAIEFSNSALAIPERGFGTAVAVIKRTGSARGAVSVDFAVSNGDATAGSDYAGPANGSLTWADGDADPKWIEFAVADDGTGESDEFFEVTLSNATGASLGAATVMRVDILDGVGINQAPNAVAGSSQTVRPGDSVTLNGSQSNDPDGDNLSYAWSQVLGPVVSLRNAGTASASFDAPGVNSDTLLRFELKVTDPNGSTDTAIANVTVTANATATSGGGGGPMTLWLLGVLGALVARRAVIRTDVSLQSSVRDRARLK
ncbi:MAG: choice-of-anchor B family protein [Gammaproteobacteria bacterium]|nr:choice-of-anchor B family protein [Gammaproteobacteria bacterium]